jgi:pimeloyl-ACP methyl ester carboxylesterase
MEAGMRVERRVVTVGDYPVRYRVAGTDGEPVILVHGLSGSTRWWSENVEALARRYRVYLVDLPGFGAMRRSPLRQGVHAATDWLIRWMETVDAQPAHLVGHSMGGQICLRVAMQRPDLVNRLALAAPAVWFVRGALLASLSPLIEETRQLSPRFMAILSYDALRAGPLTLLRSARDLLQHEVGRDLGAIRAPTLLIWGEHDAMVPVSVGYELRQLIPQSRLLVLKGSNHVPMYHDARRFNAALLHFLRGDPVGV